MTPPKITRPAIPQVEHTFPAWYRSVHTENLAYFLEMGKAVYYDKEMNYKPCICALEEANRGTWERLPSGTQITFTQP
jgi:hypothetical protein